MSEPERTLESYFADWESSAFGLGYGTGEPHTLAALKGADPSTVIADLMGMTRSGFAPTRSFRAAARDVAAR